MLRAGSFAEQTWRKSDGETLGEIARYREDAYGRRLYAQSHWELSRRVYFDTRFELDVNMDADNDATLMGSGETRCVPPEDSLRELSTAASRATTRPAPASLTRSRPGLRA